MGFDFLMDWPADDQPLWMKTRSGPLMSVPYPIEINDSPQILVRHHTPEQFRDFIIGQFEELLHQSSRQPLVCGIALHTMIVGQPYRLRMLREAGMVAPLAFAYYLAVRLFGAPDRIYRRCGRLARKESARRSSSRENGTSVIPASCRSTGRSSSCPRSYDTCR